MQGPRPRLFHFSEEPDIAAFVPRPVRVPSVRPEGREWLNGPLVWAIEAAHAFLYLFPRECPRLVAWATAETNAVDRARWLEGSRIVAYVEAAWLSRLESTRLTRYEFATEPFQSLEDAGMWVSTEAAEVIDRVAIDTLPAALAEAGVTLRVADALAPLRVLYATSLHVSGIRLRNAPSWAAERPG